MNILDKTRQLLLTYRILPNKLLGQNFLIDDSIFPIMAQYASLSQADTVLDVGAGFGFLARYIAAKCARVLAVEKDPLVAFALQDQVRDQSNIYVIEDDVLTVDLPLFDKVVCAPPYQISSALLTWLLARQFKCAVMLLQEEFAHRLKAKIGTEDYSWLTVYTYRLANVELLDFVPRQIFYPEPEVDSVIARLIPHPQPVFEVNDARMLMQMLKSVFAERNKKVINAALPFARNVLGLSEQDAKSRIGKLRFSEERVRSLSLEALGELARVLNC